MKAAGRRRVLPTPACQWREFAGFPDLLRLHRHNPQRYPHLLESVAHGPPQARYDILFAFPGNTLQLTGNGWLETADGRTPGDFLHALDRVWHSARIPTQSQLPVPFHGGWFLYLGYELAGSIEPSLAGLPRDLAWPMAFAQRFAVAVVRDHSLWRTWLVGEPGTEEQLAALECDLRESAGTDTACDLPGIDSIREEDPALHRARVARILEYIRAGDTFQVNLSRRWDIELAHPPVAGALYAQLRRTNPAPFAALVSLDAGRTIVSSSPERLASARHGRISTRPIAGTFPRSADRDEDERLAQRLVRTPKERAEHVMLVDLERNDLGRVCVPGSVQADELLVVESYRHVHHIVSNVSGALHPDVTPAQIIRAVFPGGTITGCPKVRTMQIIAELENEPRRAYTGSVGYLNRDGSLDLNILIRTLQVDGRHVSLRAGGGIVADSDPQRELEETRSKARGLLAVFEHGGAP